ncbi:hypothetical protein L484_010973 [Morus notabilis]|uniref:Uncharacterized protein n=1 Tax=Morus notabilis TaxID=981085 RepID=W9RLD3_9ROSA|nr:hypothetical protein L484_010973 [Morus notabilis]
MASFCRSALMAGTRLSMAARRKVPTPNSQYLISSPFSSDAGTNPQASRTVSAFGKVESLKPLHRLNTPAPIKSKGLLVQTSPQICVAI